ncbi:hypothetical protein ACFPN6_27965, partial [Streptomyces fimbriatus]
MPMVPALAAVRTAQRAAGDGASPGTQAPPSGSRAGAASARSRPDCSTRSRSTSAAAVTVARTAGRG